MATRTAPPPPPAPGSAPPTHRFFDWMRALNLPRRHGWIGGVCAGIAERLGIDPLIVRGIAVVIAVLGGPAVILYAAAWLLLPDSTDRIHLERLMKGDFDQATIGIGVLVVVSLLPVTQGFWYLGTSYWGEPYWGVSIGRALWTILLLTAAVFAIIWLARRAQRPSSEPFTTPATTDARPETVPEPPTASGDAAGDAAPQLPAQPAADAPAEDLAAWREQQERWKAEHTAWKQQQQASARQLRDQRAAEAHARAVAGASIADERRRLRRLANPRVTGSHVVITLGAALLVGGIAAILSQSGGGWQGYGLLVGLATATLVVALSAIVAGLFRRRSGFLGFVALLLVVSTVFAASIPPDRTLVAASYGTMLETSGRYAQPAGSFNIYSSDSGRESAHSTIDVWQGAGEVYLSVPVGMTVRVIANLGPRALEQYRYEKAKKATATEKDNWHNVSVPTTSTRLADGRHSYDFTVGSGTPTTTVHIWQGAGEVRVEQQQPDSAQPSSAPSTRQTTGANQ